MPDKKGIYEELLVANKEYPDKKSIYSLSPSEYMEALINHMARRLENKFKQLFHQAKHNEMIDLTQKIGDLIHLESKEILSLPLSSIMYRYDGLDLPIHHNMQLSKIELISNDTTRMKNFFKTLKFEMLTADSVDFMVSFIRNSGLQLLVRPIEELLKANKKIRILTSTYMNVTEPKALRRLLQYPNVEVKIYESGKESFHTKAYLFHRHSGLNSILIGSSNISHSALVNGHEWNVKIPDFIHLPAFQQAKEKFETMWNDEMAVQMTEADLLRYERRIEEAKRQGKSILASSYGSVSIDERSSYEIKPSIQAIPNEMQLNALKALNRTRKQGYKKGLVIAATGTGKTYLSAFDVHSFQPKRLLFVAHREELLDRAIETFQSVFQKENLCGKFTGLVKEAHKPFVFSTIQTLSKDESLHSFQRTEFDYIIVDEFHHAGADSYLKVLEYFEPRFLLGLTATPERTDGKDVFKLVDYNVVYEIRLHDALKHNLLVPFHYFGLADQTVDYSKIKLVNGFLDEKELVAALNTNRRVDYVIEMIQKYGYDGEQMVGLGFCVSIEHAKFMSEEFNKRGFHTTYLTGQHKPDYRKQVISQLEDERHPLQMIFTVDIFNEGIDIPKLNLILFLRPTESSTIFIQQLGRGLRKASGKEYVTILDFIGNYQKSFIVPLALMGQTNQRAFDVDSMRIAIQHEFADLPGGCYVDLEEISRKQILEKIDSIRLNSTDILKNLYKQFKKDLGRSPEIRDFLYVEQAPNLHFFIHKFGSWVKTKSKMNDCNPFDRELIKNTYALEVVERLEKMFPIKWPYEFNLLQIALEKPRIYVEDIVAELVSRFGVNIEVDQHTEFIKRAMERLTQTYKKQTWSFGQMYGDDFVVDSEFQKLISNLKMKQYIEERIEYGLIEFRRTYRPEQFLSQGKKLILYQNYTRNDIIFLSGSTAKEGQWREGVSRVGNHYYLFINLNKDESVSDHLHYKDYFIDQSHFHWQSQNQTSHQSERGKDYIYHKERGKHIHLFVRKFNEMHGMTLPFMYLGEVDYVSSHGDQPMNIKWKLHHPVPEDIFIDFVR